MKIRPTFLPLSSVTQFARRQPLVLLKGLAILGAIGSPAWSQEVTDTSWVESYSTVGSSVLPPTNDGTSTPTFLGSTGNRGIGICNVTSALCPFDCDQNLIANLEDSLLSAVNSDSSCRAALPISSDDLQAVESSFFHLGGSDPVSMGVRSDVLVLVNEKDAVQIEDVILANCSTFCRKPN